MIVAGTSTGLATMLEGDARLFHTKRYSLWHQKINCFTSIFLLFAKKSLLDFVQKKELITLQHLSRIVLRDWC